MENENFRVMADGFGPSESGDMFVSDLTEGIKCKGFLVVAMKEDGCTVAIHRMNLNDIADAIVSSDELMTASFLAKGMYDAKQYHEKAKENKLMELLRSCEP